MHIFYNCKNLEEVILPEGLTDMLWSTFARCPKLKEVTIPDSVEFIAQTTFAECSSLERVYISKNSNLEIIGLDAFRDCKALTSFYIPPKVTHLDNRDATSSRIRNGQTYNTIGSFERCTKLSTVMFSKGIKIIDNSVFRGCTNISEVYYEGTEAEWRSINIGTDNGRLSNWEAEVAAGNLTMHFEAEYPLYP
jgi:hypothetical protein